ncbi:MAG: helix-turn-helix domain protein [Bacteriophage sp.]|jgi:predicted transcriptional regulator|nr:MAG: helix-turn-helix domain protein [Bacteriophage sp.]
MNIERVNIGLSIEQKLNELGMSKSEFGRKIGVPQQNVNRILDKTSIDTDKLATISEALGYNFFKEYTDDLSDTSMEVSLAGNNNQVNGNGAHNNINGDVSAAIWEERVKSLEALLAEKERLIKVYEKMVEK